MVENGDDDGDAGERGDKRKEDASAILHGQGKSIDADADVLQSDT